MRKKSQNSWKNFLLFLLFVIANASFIFAFRWIPTMDGAAHLYNARLLQQIIFEDNQFLLQFLELNPEPVPNWSGHFILMVLLQIGWPPFLAEKLILLIITCGIPLVFRQVLVQLKAPFLAASYLVVPLIYTFVFALGFYNFYLGIFFLFASLYAWFGFQAKPKIWLAFLFAVAAFGCYFSHIVPFGLLGLVVAIDFVRRPIGYLFHKKTDLSVNQWVGRKSLGLLLLPLAVLGYRFFQSRGEIPLMPFSDFSLWKELLFRMEALMMYGQLHEKVVEKIIGFVFLSLLVYGAIHAFRHKKRLRSEILLWGFIAALILIMSLILPNQSSGGGYVTIRLVLLFWFFLMIAIGFFVPKDRLAHSLVAVAALAQLTLVQAHFKAMNWLSAPTAQMTEAAQTITPHQVIFSSRHSSIWLDGHFSNYLGIFEPVVILENYEASNDYFPLRWKQNPEVMQIRQWDENGICQRLEENFTKEGAADFPDLIVKYGDLPTDESCLDSISRTPHFHSHFKNGYVEIIAKN